MAKIQSKTEPPKKVSKIKTAQKVPRQTRLLQRKARRQARVIQSSLAPEEGKQQEDEVQLNVQDNSQRASHDEAEHLNAAISAQKPREAEEASLEQMSDSLELGKKRKNNPVPVVHKKQKMRSRHLVNKSEDADEEMPERVGSSVQNNKVEGLPFRVSPINYDHREEMVKLLRDIAEQGRIPVPTKETRTAVQIYNDCEQVGRFNQSIIWSFHCNNYEKHLGTLEDLFVKKEDADIFFKPYLLRELLYPLNTDFEMAGLINLHYKDKYAHRPIVSGIKQFRKTLQDVSTVRYCENCAQKDYSLHTKHSANCHQKDPDHQDHVRIGQLYICVLCCHMFHAQKTLAIHLTFHAYSDVFWLGFDYKTLLRWDGITEEQLAKTCLFRPPVRLNRQDKFEWLTSSKPGFIMNSAFRAVVKQEQEILIDDNGEPAEVKEDSLKQSQHSLDEDSDDDKNFGFGDNWPEKHGKPVKIVTSGRDIWAFLKPLGQVMETEDETNLHYWPPNGQYFAAGARGRLCVGYPWQFFGVVKGGASSLLEGIELLEKVMVLQKRLESGQRLVKVIYKRFWGVEIYFEIPMTNAVRVMTPQSVAQDGETELDKATLFRAARKLLGVLNNQNILCTDLWRPCFWVQTRKTEKLEVAWQFIGFHTLLRDDKDGYWSRRTLIMDREHHQYRVNNYELRVFDYFYDQSYQLLGLCLLILDKLHELPIPECRDTTANSVLTCQKSFDEIQKFLCSWLEKDERSVKLAAGLTFHLVPFSEQVRRLQTGSPNEVKLLRSIQNMFSVLGKSYINSMSLKVHMQNMLFGQTPQETTASSNQRISAGGSDKLIVRLDAFNQFALKEHVEKPLEQYQSALDQWELNPRGGAVTFKRREIKSETGGAAASGNNTRE